MTGPNTDTANRMAVDDKTVCEAQPLEFRKAALLFSFFFFNHRDLRNLRFILLKYFLLTQETLLLMMNKFFVWLVSTKYQQWSTDHCTQDNQVHALGWFSLVLCYKTLISFWNQTLIQIPVHSRVISVGFCLNSVKSRFLTFATPEEIKATKTTEAVVWTCCWLVLCL